MGKRKIIFIGREKYFKNKHALSFHVSSKVTYKFNEFIVDLTS